MKYVIKNAIIINGKKDMTEVKDKVIVVEDGKIIAIKKDSEELKDLKVIDLQGKYIIPGLINLHVHLPASGKPKKKPSDPVKLVALVNKFKIMQKVIFKMCANAAKTQLYSGVTTIRTVGGYSDYDGKIRDEINRGKLVGPRILAANMAVSVPGGHMANSLAYAANNVEEAKKYALDIIATKPDIIKLMITGGVLDAKVKGEPGELKMPIEYVKTVCDEAHKAGLKVAAHVESPVGVQVALEGGVDTIEHGAKPTSEIIKLFKDRNACHVATLSPALPYALFDQSISHVSDMEKFNGEVVFNGIKDCAKECLKEGITVGLGTDTGCPYITHYDMWREVNYFKKFCDVSNSFALHTATLINAQVAGIDKETGSIEEGKFADMVVLKNNPLEDIKALRNVDMVIMKGNIINNPKIKKMKNVEVELDKFA